MIHEEATSVEERNYDVVIVGAGFSGAILSKVLGDAGKKVLLLEAGTATAATFSGYLDDLATYYTANVKVPNAPYPYNPDAPQPSVLDVVKIGSSAPVSTGYFVQKGPLPFRSDYLRTQGGTSLHWLGTTLRMLPEDFMLHTLYGRGRDWPLTYEDLMPYYRMAEQEIGVSANVEEQQYLGIHFEDGYVYPMFKIPPTYLDQVLAGGLEGMTIDYDGEAYPVRVISTPAGRNSMPNPVYDGGKGYTPRGAVGNPDIGLRCAGNASCVPICPIQAKYNAFKTLATVKREHVDIVVQAVASRVLIDSADGRVTGIEYKAYKDPKLSAHTVHIARGRVYILAAHAIENAKLLLASNITSTSGLVGKNLMDHPVLLTWGLMPMNVGSFRGPVSTSGIETLRGGRFRAQRSAFRIEIANGGWNWAANTPFSLVSDLVDQKNMFGTQLRQSVNQTTTRQCQIDFLLEQLPEETNKVTIDPAYMDQLGNYRPVIHYNLSDYTRAGMKVARNTAQQLFQRLGVEDYTSYDAANPGYLTYQGQGYVYNGAGHAAGTHVMGTTKRNSVVNSWQHSWDHPNLYLVGCGSMPGVATSNPTLTMSALAYRTAEHVLQELNGK